MQFLISLLTQISYKAWVAIVLTVLSGGAVTVYFFSSVNAGSIPTEGNRPVVVFQTGPSTVPNHGGPLPVVPEANAGPVLVPVVACMLLVASRRLLPAKAAAAPAEAQITLEPGA